MIVKRSLFAWEKKNCESEDQSKNWDYPNHSIVKIIFNLEESKIYEDNCYQTEFRGKLQFKIEREDREVRTSINRPENKKLMTMHKVLLPRDESGRYWRVSLKKGRSAVASTQDNVDTLIRQLEYYIKTNKKMSYSDQKQHKQQKDQCNNNN